MALPVCFRFRGKFRLEIIFVNGISIVRWYDLSDFVKVNDMNDNAVNFNVCYLFLVIYNSSMCWKITIDTFLNGVDRRNFSRDERSCRTVHGGSFFFFRSRLCSSPTWHG